MPPCSNVVFLSNVFLCRCSRHVLVCMPDWMHYCFSFVICGSHSSSCGRWNLCILWLTSVNCCSCVVYEGWETALPFHLRSLMFLNIKIIHGVAHKIHIKLAPSSLPFQPPPAMRTSPHAMSYALLMLISFNYPLHQSFSSAISHGATCLRGSPGQRPAGKLNLFPDLQGCSVVAAQRHRKTTGVWSQKWQQCRLITSVVKFQQFWHKSP